MKHALLVGVPERATDGHLDRALGVEAMARLLDELGGWSSTVCTGAEATRPRVLAALETMVSTCRAEDACLFYFFGHGGVVRFSGLAGDLGQRPVFYLATLRPEGSSERVGVLDIEISDALARLDRICSNVATIIDCCHAAAMVRDGPFPTITPPSWVRTLAERLEHRALLLSVKDHPRVVRLFGSSSLRRGYATQHSGGLYGLLTQCFVDLVREAGLRCDRLTWDAIAIRAREWVSRQRGTEEQRVVLAGPRHRLLFSRHAVPQPRSAAFIPAPTTGRGWIRAGLLQGVRLGDRWGIAELSLDADLQPRFLVEAEVRSTDLDSAEVVLSDPSIRPVLGATAIMHVVEQRLPVVVDGVTELEDALRASNLVRTVASNSPEVIARVRPAAIEGPSRALDVFDANERPIWLGVSAEAEGLRDVVDLVEDRARARRFEDSLAMASSSAARDIDVVWRWGTFGPDDHPQELPLSPPKTRRVPRIHVGDRLWVELSHRGSTPRQWFVSVLEIGIEGRLSLLNAHEPDGIEVIPGVESHVGLRGHRRRQGLACHWPSRVPLEGPRPARLIILASHRPIPLGHLVRLPEPDDLSAFAVQGLWPHAAGAIRGDAPRPFVTSEKWAWGTVPFEVDPSPRGGGSSGACS
ncbi:caspase family protein [Paraliomyxa miuraensis]|uniref:caspase family protein n=1 Tax=Paraliomyxa miuraensis TaxID=376150 RepID=UPI0022574E6C|nr:caspase family protein [Paraliomyxa miuraensis]MCX4243940.1 caspase family protein [Paraliomyxa miuraensis]